MLVREMRRLSRSMLLLAALGASCGGQVSALTDAGGEADAGNVDAAVPASAGRWLWQSNVPSSDGLAGVWVNNENDAWAVGETTILHWTGAAWSLVPSGTMNDLAAIWGTGADDVWAVAGGWGGNGNFANLIHWDGQTWAPWSSPTAMNLHGVWGRAADDFWVGGESGVEGAIFHYDGQSWTTEFDSASYGPLAFAGDGGADVWAVGEMIGPASSDDFAMRRNSDGSWSPVATGTNQLLEAIWASGTGDAWAVGYDTKPIIHWDGTAWAPASGPAAALAAIWGAQSDNVWAVGAGISHWDGSVWSSVPYRGAGLEAVSGSDAGTVWAVGANGTIFHFDPTSTATPTCGEIGGQCGDASACAPGAGHQTDYSCAGGLVCCVNEAACGGAEPECCTDAGDHPRPLCLDGAFVCLDSSFCPMPP